MLYLGAKRICTAICIDPALALEEQQGAVRGRDLARTACGESSTFARPGLSGLASRRSLFLSPASLTLPEEKERGRGEDALPVDDGR